MRALLTLYLLLVVTANANLPHRVNILKQKKDQAIFSTLDLVYKEYSKSLLKLQTELVTSNRLTDANAVQSEFFLNSGYIDSIGKSYQFVFDRQRPLPDEAEIYRETRNEKVKIALKKNIMVYITELNKAQVAYMNNQDLVNARKATDEMRLATLELRKIDSIVSVGSSTRSPLLQVPSSSKLRSFQLGNGIELEMIWVPPGSFLMGSPKTEPERAPDETQRNVTIERGFYLGKYEVTQEQYEIMMRGNHFKIDPNPSYFANQPNCPVENISLDEIEVFLNRLNHRLSDIGELKKGLRFILPTEAQWEYACRAGTKTAYSFGSKITSFNANYNFDLDKGTTKPVGSYPANNWGFFDMHGNVWENTSSIHDSSKSNSEESFVRKGGSWWSKSINIRSARRLENSRTKRHRSIGFRVCLQ